MSDHEVTQAEYQAVMGSNPSTFNGTQFYDDVPKGEVLEKRPVENIFWSNAIKYCNERSIKEGLEPCYTIVDNKWDEAFCDFTKNGYRLPTEAEWEYAARGGEHATNKAVYSGTSVGTELKNYAWYEDNTGVLGGYNITPRSRNEKVKCLWALRYDG